MNLVNKIYLKILKIFNTPNKIGEDEIKKEFKIIVDQIKKITISYYIFRNLFTLRSVPEIGQEQADQNVKIMRYYGSFFTQTELSHVITFVMGITNCFDNHSYKGKSPINIKGLMNKVNCSKKEFNDLKKKHAKTFTDLYKIRNENFAHLDSNAINRSFVILDVEKLINAIQQLVIYIGNQIYQVDYFLDWDETKNSTIGYTKHLLSNLSKYHINLEREIIKDFGNK